MGEAGSVGLQAPCPVLMGSMPSVPGRPVSGVLLHHDDQLECQEQPTWGLAWPSGAHLLLLSYLDMLLLSSGLGFFLCKMTIT